MSDGDELSGYVVHFSCEHSYFCGKTRAYLRYKQQRAASETLRADLDGCSATLQFVDVLVTGGPSGLRAELERLTGSPTLPQVRLQDDVTYVQDSAAIIDALELQHPAPAILPTPTAGPKQRVAAQLLDLFADEWMIVWCYHTRWRSNMKTAKAKPPGEMNPARVPGSSCANNRDYTALQLSHLRNDISPVHNNVVGSASSAVNKAARIDPTLDFFDAPTNPGFNCAAASEAGDVGLLLNHDTLGIYNQELVTAWHASYHRFMERFEAHLDVHDYVLGGRPCLADFTLMGPLYGHIFRDPVSGFELRCKYPLVADWVERVNGTNAVSARTYGQDLWRVDGSTGKIYKTATANTDKGDWLPNDEVPATLLSLLEVFFEEMWPVMRSTCDVISTFIKQQLLDGLQDDHDVVSSEVSAAVSAVVLDQGVCTEAGYVHSGRVELPVKSFGADGGGALSMGGTNFSELQTPSDATIGRATKNEAAGETSAEIKEAMKCLENAEAGHSEAEAALGAAKKKKTKKAAKAALQEAVTAMINAQASLQELIDAAEAAATEAAAEAAAAAELAAVEAPKDGALTTAFTLGGVAGRRMVTGYHGWRLQRIQAELKDATATPESMATVSSMLDSVGGSELLELEGLLSGCGTFVRDGGRIYATNYPIPEPEPELEPEPEPEPQDGAEGDGAERGASVVDQSVEVDASVEVESALEGTCEAGVAAGSPGGDQGAGGVE